jgi:hypothetical protein
MQISTCLGLNIHQNGPEILGVNKEKVILHHNSCPKLCHHEHVQICNSCLTPKVLGVFSIKTA